MKTYVISLDRVPTRWANFRAVNKELSATRFRALDGDSLVPAELANSGLIVPSLELEKSALGRFCSHVALWREAVASKSSILILEDDSVVHQDLELLFYRLQQSMPTDWDFVALGFSASYSLQFELLPKLTSCLSRFQQYEVDKLSTFKSLELHPVAYRLKTSFGTPGYAVTPRGAKKLLDKLLPLKSSLDLALNEVYADLAAYISFPPLVITPSK